MISPPSFTIRLALDAEAERVTALLVAQLREHTIPVPESHVAKSVAAMMHDATRGFVLVAVVGDVIEGVAYVSYASPLEHAGTVAWLEELYVTPEHRDRGVGRRLIEAVVDGASAHGCVSLELEVQSDHARAADLYQREGFRSLRRDHMAKPLAAWDW